MYNTGISNNPNQNKSENQHKIYWREITEPYLPSKNRKLICLVPYVAPTKIPNSTKGWYAIVR